MQRFLLTFTTILLLCLTPLAYAQDAETPIDEPTTAEDMNAINESADTESNTIEAVPEDFTGTLSDEDPESTANKDKELFGPDEAGEEATPQNAATHTLKFDYTAQVLIANSVTGAAAVEIDYTVKLEEEVQITTRRIRSTGRAAIMTDIVGSLAGNDLFACKLEVEINDVDVDMSTRRITTLNQYDEVATSQLALQLKFTKSDLMEDWYSNCTAFDGSKLNTKGEQEKYLYQILLAAQPSLEGLLIEDFDPTESASLPISTEEIIVDDVYGDEEFLLTGSGNVEVEPIE